MKKKKMKSLSVKPAALSTRPLAAAAAEPRRKPGRPRVDEPRERIAMRLLPEELVAFKAEAKRRGVGYSTWMRLVCRRASGLDPAAVNIEF
jgi:uncharacterized protein (DUF4415 family)